MKDEMSIRPADPSEADVLTELALRSKAHWGYPIEWLDRWRPELTVTQTELVEHAAFVSECDGRIAGFYLLRPATRPNTAELDFLFVEPAVFGSGIGESLFRHAIGTARTLGYKSMTWGSDPNADGFYVKMGARKVGERVSSTVPGRANAEMEIEL